MPIILCMIVKNEEHVLRRAIDSALPVIDAACICDTGSTDNTLNVAKDAFEAAGIPLSLRQHEWVNFGANRTRSFEEARAFAQELGWDLATSYALFLDADMILAIDGFEPDQLSLDSYRLRQGTSAFQYDNTRLARLSLDWNSIGATHEFWSADDAKTSERLNSLWIVDVGDGGSKTDKFERDIQLLEAELEQLPGNPRTMFYLAQSYYDSGRVEEARDLYQQRAAAGGWGEESWYAAFRTGMCSLRLDDWERAMGELLSAWQQRPSRAEPLYELSKAARQRGASAIAMLAAEKALRIPLPEDDRLFIDGHAHTYGPVEEISISGYYTGQHKLGMAACDALLHNPATPAHMKNLAASNAAFYVQQLERSSARRIDLPSDLVQPTYSPSVGSIYRVDGGYVMVNRVLNYYVKGKVEFVTRDPGGQYITRNVWLTLDRDLNLTSAAPIDDTLFHEVAPVPSTEAQVVGIEDVRLFNWQNAWWVIGNTRQFDPERWYYTVVLGRLDSSGQKLEHLVPLSYWGRQDHEKNWLPLVHEGRLLLLYASFPTIILEPDTETGICREVHRQIPAADLSRYRGSSPFLPLEDGRYLFVVHDVVMVDESRVYLHRFVEMDSNLTITRASRLFTFQHTGVEYCCGICLSHDNQEILISCNWQERESWIIGIPRDQLERMLIPIEDLGRLDLLDTSDARTIERREPGPHAAAPTANGAGDPLGTSSARVAPTGASQRRRRWWPLSRPVGSE